MSCELVDEGGPVLTGSATLALGSRCGPSCVRSLVFLLLDRRSLKQSVQDECQTCNLRFPQEQLGGLATQVPQNLGAEVLRLKYAAVSWEERRDRALLMA